MAQVTAVNISERKGVRKHEVPYIDLKLRHGIVGDAHAGDWHRQISLLAEESVDTMRAVCPIALDEVTPWSHMDYGITHEYLVREYNKALAAQTTPPCNRACNACGANHLLGGPCFDYSQNLV